ncbi:hypothetical protein LCGC14_1720760, partial [marine sediment metagenome]
MTPLEQSLRQGIIVLTSKVKAGVAVHKLVYQERTIVEDTDLHKLQWVYELLVRNNLVRY